MSPSPLVLFHISAAVIGLLSGFLAMLFRKGSGLHGAAGTVFFGSMLCMASSAAWIAAFQRPNRINVIVGLLTSYLVVTAWRAAKRRDGATDRFDLLALLFILSVGTAGWVSGFEAANSPRGTKDGMPAAAYFVFGSVALLCGLSDIRMIRRGDLTGPRRIARHLWRMCLALLITTLSFYPGQARQLPAWLRGQPLLFAPHILLFASMIYYRLHYRPRKRVQRDQLAKPAWSATSLGGPAVMPGVEGVRLSASGAE